MNPAVRRVHTKRGSHIVPELDERWTDLAKLRWRLAVALHDAGLPADSPLTVEHGGTSTSSHGTTPLYALTAPGYRRIAGDYRDTWFVITGFGYGLEFTRTARP